MHEKVKIYFSLMKNWSKKKKLLFGIMFVILLLQAIQPSKNIGSSNAPTDIAKTLPIPGSIFALLKTSCYDCHSNHTNYPWYNHITPINWWVADHINEGKKELNFTIFGNYKRHHQLQMLEAIGETVQMGAMPLKSYLSVHKEARLSEAEKKAIYDWARKSMDEITKAR